MEGYLPLPKITPMLIGLNIFRDTIFWNKFCRGKEKLQKIPCISIIHFYLYEGTLNILQKICWYVIHIASSVIPSHKAQY